MSGISAKALDPLQVFTGKYRSCEWSQKTPLASQGLRNWSQVVEQKDPLSVPNPRSFKQLLQVWCESGVLVEASTDHQLNSRIRVGSPLLVCPLLSPRLRTREASS